MRAKPIKVVNGKQIECRPEEAQFIFLHFPTELMAYRTLTINGGGTWKWNHDVERPTISPSILSKSGPNKEHVCHSFIKDGQARFLNDCTHEFAGQTVDLLEVDI